MTNPNGKVGVNTENLRTFGVKVSGRAEEAKALGLGDLGSAVVMPESVTMLPASETCEAHGALADHAHTRSSHAGSEIALAADKYEHVEEHNAHKLQTAVEPNTEYRW